MVSQKSVFVCQQCGYETSKWLGKCPECGEWNTLVETFVTKSVGKGSIKNRKAGEPAKLVRLTDITSKSTTRTPTSISELDRVLGGGLVPGQVVLVAGDPGIGKSTLLLQVAQKVSAHSQSLGSVLYVSGEESVSQIKIRADRLGVTSKAIELFESNDIDDIVATVEEKGVNPTKLSLIIVDSIQTVATSELSGMAGSVGQVRECAFKLVRLAKSLNVPIFIVGHVTKEGTVAGPSVLMHIVDTVLWFEGEKETALRMLRAVKNRFGPTDEVGIFDMQDKGIFSVENVEAIFLSSGKKELPGSVTTVIMEGTRPMLVEVQSLVVPSKLPFPKRVAQGVDIKRVEMLLAVLIRRAGTPLYESDVFVNVAGGANLKGDPSCDLAISLSLASSFFDKPIPSGTIAIGEVGLLGEIRPVTSQEKRIKEARRLGYKNAISNNVVKYLQEGIKRYFR